MVNIWISVVLLYVLTMRSCSGALVDQLSSIRFLHEGVTTSGESFSWYPIECMYLELENVSCAQCSWGGPCSYKYVAESTPVDCNASVPQKGYDRPGGDKGTIVQTLDDYRVCQKSCCSDNGCFGWVYVTSAPAQFMNCKAGDHCCYLKGTTVNPTPNNIPGIITGAIDRSPPVKAPALGIRSAVPLGGLGAGALELRGDGTFHEVTIQNQHPASSAKYGVLSDAILGFYLQNGQEPGQFRVIRTNPPNFASGISQIGYSGSYPVSRLHLIDNSLEFPVSVYAYSRLRPTDLHASAEPAVVFTLVVENPGISDGKASFFFSLPFGGISDCARISQRNVRQSPALTVAQCQKLCDGTCASWNFDSGNSICYLADDIPHSVYRQGWYCGISGYWSSWPANGNSGLTLHATPVGASSSSSAGNITLKSVSSDPGNSKFSYAVGSDLASIYKAFVSGNGDFSTSNANVTVGPFQHEVYPHGAAAISVKIPAKQKVTLSIVFAWFFPERDHMGVSVGNFYSKLGRDSEDFANRYADVDFLEKVVRDINRHHVVYSSVNTSYPIWLQDHVINQMSHFRGLMYLRDGRLREYEAPDCPDVDSIHNDYQRHLPYFWNFPEFELSKIFTWGLGQDSDGHLWEDLGSFGLGPLDKWADRIMADTTTLWIMEQWEFFLHTNNLDYLKENYAKIVRAINWVVKNAMQNNQGLPYRLVCTYDIIDFDQYNTTTFNSMIYLASLLACEKMSQVLDDISTEKFCRSAFDFGQSQLITILWNSTHNFFRAYSGGNAIMGDCLYGQVVAHHLGLGWLVDSAKISAHLKMELQANGDPFGIKVVTGRHNTPSDARSGILDLVNNLGKKNNKLARKNVGVKKLAEMNERLGFDGQDDVIWLGAAPDWSYLQIALGNFPQISDALSPSENQLRNYRERLNDMWNIVGITTPGDWGDNEGIHGMPYVTSHYGFVMTDYYLLPVLSGQQPNFPAGNLAFSPKYSCPFNLPLLLCNCTGVLSCDSGKYTVDISFGKLSLPAGGLSVNGKVYPYAVSLSEGDKITW